MQDPEYYQRKADEAKAASEAYRRRAAEARERLAEQEVETVGASPVLDVPDAEQLMDEVAELGLTNDWDIEDHIQGRMLNALDPDGAYRRGQDDGRFFAFWGFVCGVFLAGLVGTVLGLDGGTRPMIAICIAGGLIGAFTLFRGQD